MRLFVARFPGGQSRVLWTYHHALLDGRSFIVLREWFALYDAARGGEVVALPPARPYRDYIVWRRSLDLAAAEAFWRTALGTFSRCDAAGDRGATIRRGWRRALRRRSAAPVACVVRAAWPGGRSRRRHGQHDVAGGLGGVAAPLQWRIRHRVRRHPRRTGHRIRRCHPEPACSSTRCRCALTSMTTPRSCRGCARCAPSRSRCDPMSTRRWRPCTRGVGSPAARRCSRAWSSMTTRRSTRACRCPGGTSPTSGRRTSRSP